MNPTRRSKAILRFKQLVVQWAARLRVRPRQIRVQRMTRKWGSCSKAGRVSFASALLRQPRRFREHVVLHELLHLRVRNHGRLHRAYVAAYAAIAKKHGRRIPPSPG